MTDTYNPDIGNYQRYSEAANLATLLGRTNAAQRAQRKAGRYGEGLDTSGIGVQDFADWESLGPGSSDAALRTLTQMKKRGIGRSGAKDPGRALNHFKLNLNKGVEGLMKQGLQAEIDPSLAAAQQRADEMAGTAAISASDEMAMRSKIAAQVRANESSRLGRIGAALGIGNVENSPAGAALAARASEEADQTLVSSLRDLGLQVSATNREQQARDIQLATSIATARYNVLNGDSASLIQMRGDIASMIDALYSRDTAIDLQRQALNDASSTSLTDRIGNWTDVAQGLVSLGTSAYQGFQSPTK